MINRLLHRIFQGTYIIRLLDPMSFSLAFGRQVRQPFPITDRHRGAPERFPLQLFQPQQLMYRLFVPLPKYLFVFSALAQILKSIIVA